MPLDNVNPGDEVETADGTPAGTITATTLQTSTGQVRLLRTAAGEYDIVPEGELTAEYSLKGDSADKRQDTAASTGTACTWPDGPCRRDASATAPITPVDPSPASDVPPPSATPVPDSPPAVSNDSPLSTPASPSPGNV